MEARNEKEAMYIPPVLEEVGDFTEHTLGYTGYNLEMSGFFGN